MGITLNTNKCSCFQTKNRQKGIAKNRKSDIINLVNGDKIAVAKNRNFR